MGTTTVVGYVDSVTDVDYRRTTVRQPILSIIWLLSMRHSQERIIIIIVSFALLHIAPGKD